LLDYSMVHLSLRNSFKRNAKFGVSANQLIQAKGTIKSAGIGQNQSLRSSKQCILLPQDTNFLLKIGDKAGLSRNATYLGE
jgi:hypothetical protein